MIYTLHMLADDRPLAGDESDEARFDSLVAIPEGKAPWALIFPPLWLAWHKLWWELAIYILISVLILTLLATPMQWAAILLSGLPGVFLLLEGHQLRRRHLDAAGFQHVAIVEATSEELALRRGLASLTNTPVRPAAAFPKTKRSHQDDDNLSFGMFQEQQS